MHASLVRALHARLPTSADSARAVLYVRAARVTPDSLTVEFYIGDEWRCGAV